ncbi:MAG: type II secretion system protein [Planctomycetota bacterium]|jgi:prepilin-type N-terminal cleavage/methylation domain-containing protein
MNKKAFTLVELLVVIAIIALLMSILMPALARVRKQAKDVICQSNLRQWGSIFAMYTADNDGSFQEGWDQATGTGNWWMDSTRSYYANHGDIRCCPNASNLTREVAHGFLNTGIWADWNGGFFTKGEYGSYGINGWVENKLRDSVYPDMAPKRWRTDRVSGAARVPLFLDAPWIDCWPEAYDRPPPLDNLDWQQGSQMGRFCKNRHDGYINGVFLDYSVNKIGLKEMWRLKWNRKFFLEGPWTKEGNVQPADWPEWMQEFKDY